MIKKPQNKKKKKEKNPIVISCYAWCKQHLVFFVIIYLFFLNKYIPIYIALLIMENGSGFFKSIFIKDKSILDFPQ